MKVIAEIDDMADRQTNSYTHENYAEKFKNKFKGKKNMWNI